MSEIVTSGQPPAQPPEARPTGGPRPPDQRPGAGTWRLTWTGLRTVATLELRQRVRSTRWIIVLALWFLVLLALTLLIRQAVQSTVGTGEGLFEGGLTPQQARERAGATLFGLIVFLVLSLGALIAPALSATSVNGDRSAGVLATLQTTLLSPAEIVLGKLLASWATALALLVTAAPFILWAYLDGGTPAGRLFTTLALLALTLLVVCAIGLGWSAVTARTPSSTVLTYLTVMFLGLGLPLVFAFSLPLVQREDRVAVRYVAAEPVFDAEGNEDPAARGRCAEEVQTQDRYHTELNWWLLAPNPYVVVADAAPRPQTAGFGLDDPLTIIREGAREARLGPPATEDNCYFDEATAQARERARVAEREALGIMWPFGLAADLALGAAFTVVAVRRLRTPTRNLPRGTRVA